MYSLWLKKIQQPRVIDHHLLSTLLLLVVIERRPILEAQMFLRDRVEVGLHGQPDPTFTFPPS